MGSDGVGDGRGVEHGLVGKPVERPLVLGVVREAQGPYRGRPQHRVPHELDLVHAPVALGARVDPEAGHRTRGCPARRARSSRAPQPRAARPARRGSSR